MKYCEKYAALLDLFVDGELTPEEMVRVQAHLAACPGCQAYVDDALAIRAGFPDAEETAVPEGFAEGVMERVRRDVKRERMAVERKRRSFRRWAGTFGVLAACCALVIFVRTGPDGRNNSVAVTASSDGAALESYAMDTGGAGGNAAPQMAEEPAEAAKEAGPEREKTARMTAADNEDAGEPVEDPLEYAASLPAAVSPAGTAPEAADDGGEKKAELHLTAEEAGDLLSGFAPVWETDSEKAYELSAEECAQLLEALGRPEELLTAESVLVVVTG